jgi:integrating conjugative element membrane protein (TIGR03745 family)
MSSLVSRSYAAAKGLALALAVAAAAAPGSVMAALPAAIDPTSGAPAAGNFIDYFKFSANDALIALGLLISAAGFFIAAWSTIAKFMQARQGRAEWSEVAITAAIAGLLMVGVSYLLTQSAGIVA